MYLKGCPAYKGKIYLSYVQGYRDENGKSKQKTVVKIGYLTDLEKIYDDSITYFRRLIKDKTEEEINKLIIDNLKSKKIDKNAVTKNLGYFALKKNLLRTRNLRYCTTSKKRAEPYMVRFCSFLLQKQKNSIYL